MNDRSQQLRRRLADPVFTTDTWKRPRSQLSYYNEGGNKAVIYGLGNKGGAFIRKEDGLVGRNLSWGEKNRAVRGMFLEHAILVSDITVALELSCREKGVHLITEDQLQNVPQQPFQWRVKLEKGTLARGYPGWRLCLGIPGRDRHNRARLLFPRSRPGHHAGHPQITFADFNLP